MLINLQSLKNLGEESMLHPNLVSAILSFASKIGGLEKEPGLLENCSGEAKKCLAYQEKLPKEILKLLLSDESYYVRKAAFENHWFALSKGEAQDFIRRHCANFLEEYEIREEKSAEKSLDEETQSFWQKLMEWQKKLKKEKEEAEFILTLDECSVTIKGVENFVDFLESFPPLDIPQAPIEMKRVLANLLVESKFSEIRAWAAQNCDERKAEILVLDPCFAVKLGLTRNPKFRCRGSLVLANQNVVDSEIRESIFFEDPQLWEDEDF